jgi:glycosyltransferase involved in cell wall biosynthesis
VRALAGLSRQVPVVWTLHDAWALTGHCAYFIDCQRWQTGCGACPDLRRAPAVRTDHTAQNWQRKRAIYADSRLAVATPSRWLMRQVEQSILHPWRRRVLPNGVDTGRYQPANRRVVRAALGLPEDAFICMFIALNTSRNDAYKDATTIDRAVQDVLGRRTKVDLLFVRVGNSDGLERGPHFHDTDYIADPARVAQYYQAADVLLHAAHAENFPCVVLEAMACGTPVIATAVGGIPEQIRDGVTGFLVARGDSAAMANRIELLLNDRRSATQIGEAAAQHVRRSYCLDQQAEAYVGWFGELQSAWRASER